MTKNEIQRLISSKIKGFGHMIDDVSLAKILNGIIDLIPGELPVASADTLGGVKVGDGLSVTEDGTLSASGDAQSPKLLIAHFAHNGSEDEIVLSLDADGETVYEQETSNDGGFIPLYTAAEHGAPVTGEVAAKWALTHPFVTFDKEGTSIPIMLVPVSNNVTFFMPDGGVLTDKTDGYSFYSSYDISYKLYVGIQQNSFGLTIVHES